MAIWMMPLISEEIVNYSVFILVKTYNSSTIFIYYRVKSTLFTCI